ncbi:hypothetical protein E2562_011028 [Oryza meyeriana var. granulata]|uniref:Uncharacterized protein n=1 Tax=Oryza meyeriana var. granulata TaxID=110450 RepID=A0A6G1EWK1_9ORYZ|nr:hypothetical protein E2562_011028 [Oryza meyeriana var. granulata]
MADVSLAQPSVHHGASRIEQHLGLDVDLALVAEVVEMAAVAQIEASHTAATWIGFPGCNDNGGSLQA